MNRITAAEIKPSTHVWIGTDLVYVDSVRATTNGFISINDGDRLVAGDKLVAEVN